jgi:hypothetical protein
VLTTARKAKKTAQFAWPNQKYTPAGAAACFLAVKTRCKMDPKRRCEAQSFRFGFGTAIASWNWNSVGLLFVRAMPHKTEHGTCSTQHAARSDAAVCGLLDGAPLQPAQFYCHLAPCYLLQPESTQVVGSNPCWPATQAEVFAFAPSDFEDVGPQQGARSALALVAAELAKRADIRYSESV